MYVEIENSADSPSTLSIRCCIFFVIASAVIFLAGASIPSTAIRPISITAQADIITVSPADYMYSISA
jgi:hypothetical protein